MQETEDDVEVNRLSPDDVVPLDVRESSWHHFCKMNSFLGEIVVSAVGVEECSCLSLCPIILSTSCTKFSLVPRHFGFINMFFLVGRPLAIPLGV